VLALLRAAGHEVHAIALAGDVEQAHLRTPGIGQQTHIDDVIGLVRAEELQDVELVGHSWDGCSSTARSPPTRPSTRCKWWQRPAATSRCGSSR
jgi:hypothetical protein